jgi:hypothetical protein
MQPLVHGAGVVQCAPFGDMGVCFISTYGGHAAVLGKIPIPGQYRIL